MNSMNLFSEMLLDLFTDLQKMKPGDTMTIQVDDDASIDLQVGECVHDEDEDEEEDLPFDDECDACDNRSCPAHPCHSCSCEDEDEEDEDECPDTDFCLELPWIDHIIFNDPATVVFWCDGTKTVVKCMEGEKFERYAGFAAACMKKLFGTTSNAKNVMNLLDVNMHQEEPVPEKKPAEPKKPDPEESKRHGIEDMIYTIGMLDVLKALMEKKEHKHETSAE